MLQDISNQDHSLDKTSNSQIPYNSQLNDAMNDSFNQDILSSGNCLLPISTQYYQNRPESFLNTSWNGGDSFSNSLNSQDPAQPLIYQKLINNGFIPFQNSSPFSNGSKNIDYRQNSFGYFGQDANNLQNFPGEDLTTLNQQSNISNILCPTDLSHSDIDNNQNANQISNFDIQQLFNLDQNEEQKLREREQNAVMWFEQFRNAQSSNQTPPDPTGAANQQQQLGHFNENDLVNSGYYSSTTGYQQEIDPQPKEDEMTNNGNFESPQPIHSITKRQKSCRYPPTTYQEYKNDGNFYDTRNSNHKDTQNKSTTKSLNQKASTQKLEASSFLPRLLNNYSTTASSGKDVKNSIYQNNTSQKDNSLDLFLSLPTVSNGGNSTSSSPNASTYQSHSIQNTNHQTNNNFAFDNLQSLVTSKSSGIINSLNLANSFPTMPNYPIDYFSLAQNNVFNDIITNNNNNFPPFGITSSNYKKTNRKSKHNINHLDSNHGVNKKIKLDSSDDSQQNNLMTHHQISNTPLHTNNIGLNHQNQFSQSVFPNNPSNTPEATGPNLNGLLNVANALSLGMNGTSTPSLNGDFNLKLSSISNGISGIMKTSTNSILSQDITHEDTNSTSNDSSTGALTTTVYFWQYNAQCKGPKAVKLVGEGVDSPLGSSSPSSYDMSTSGASRSSLSYCPIASQSLPGYPLVVFEDPVQKRQDLVHCSKLRRGDGNDVTPNINRLRLMGDELERLSGQIARQGEIIMTGGVNGPNANSLSGILAQNQNSCPQNMNIRIDQGSLAALDPSSAIEQSWCVEEAKREKNKLASKICRLKKKAFHESNKIKYTGLGLEYCELANIITQLKQILIAKRNGSTATISFEDTFEINQAASGNNSSRKRKRNDKSNPESHQTIIVPGESLYEQALNLKNTIHTTLVAGRTDPFVEEVLQLSRSNQTRSNLLKRLSSTNPLTVDSINNNNQGNGCYSESNSRSATPNSHKTKYSTKMNPCKNTCLLPNNGNIQQSHPTHYLDYSQTSSVSDPTMNQAHHQSIQEYITFDGSMSNQVQGNPLDLTSVNHHHQYQQSQQQPDQNSFIYSNYHLLSSTDHQTNQGSQDPNNPDQASINNPNDPLKQQSEDGSQFLFHDQGMYEMDPNEAAAVAYLSSAQNSLIIAANGGCNSSTDFSQMLNDSNGSNGRIGTTPQTTNDPDAPFSSTASYYSQQQHTQSSELHHPSSASTSSMFSVDPGSHQKSGNDSNSSTPLDGTSINLSFTSPEKVDKSYTDDCKIDENIRSA